MQVLSRGPNESIILGGDIRITVLATHGARVRIGIEAPAGVSIFREEIHVRETSRGREAGAREDQPDDPNDQP